MTATAILSTAPLIIAGIIGIHLCLARFKSRRPRIAELVRAIETGKVIEFRRHKK